MSEVGRGEISAEERRLRDEAKEGATGKLKFGPSARGAAAEGAPAPGETPRLRLGNLAKNVKAESEPDSGADTLGVASSGGKVRIALGEPLDIVRDKAESQPDSVPGALEEDPSESPFAPGKQYRARNSRDVYTVERYDPKSSMITLRSNQPLSGLQGITDAQFSKLITNGDYTPYTPPKKD